MKNLSQRNEKKKHFQIAALVLFIMGSVIVILGKGLTLNPNSTGNALLGKKAYDFQVQWLQGQEIYPDSKARLSLDQFKGKSIILNFWASWCVSCRQEATVMESFWRKHKEKNVVMIGIAIQDTSESALAFAKHFGKTYILGLDDDGKAGIDYGVTGVPETFFIDTNGIIKHKEAGPVSLKLLEQTLPLITK